MNRMLMLWILALATGARADESSEPQTAPPAIDADRTGLLKARIPVIAGTRFLKNDRLEITPSVALSFRDAFFKKTVVGLEVGWHFSDALALSVRGAYSFSAPSGAIQVCSGTTTGGCQSPERAELAGHAPGDLIFLTGGSLEWTPLYGKISVLAETFRNFELFADLGGTLVGYRGISANAGGALALTGGGELGLGARFFFTRWLALRLEIKDLVYPEQVEVGTVSSPRVRQQFFGQLGLSIFLPSSRSDG